MTSKMRRNKTTEVLLLQSSSDGMYFKLVLMSTLLLLASFWWLSLTGLFLIVCSWILLAATHQRNESVVSIADVGVFINKEYQVIARNSARNFAPQNICMYEHVSMTGVSNCLGLKVRGAKKIVQLIPILNAFHPTLTQVKVIYDKILTMLEQ